MSNYSFKLENLKQLSRSSEVIQSGGQCAVLGMTHFSVTLALMTASVTGGTPLIKHVCCLPHQSQCTIKKTMKKTMKKEKHYYYWTCLIRSLLLPGCWNPDVCAAHRCSHHSPLHVIRVPFSFRSPVSCYTPRLHGLGFLQIVSIKCHFGSLSLSFITEAQ